MAQIGSEQCFIFLKWLGVVFYCFIFLKWLGVVFYFLKIARSGSEHKMVIPKNNKYILFGNFE